MAKFNEYKEFTYEIRITSAPAGAWYEDRIGENIKTCGYNRYDKLNEWRVDVDGEERLIAHNDARRILDGDIPQWSTILVKGIGDRKDRVAVVSGRGTFGGLSITYVCGGGTIINPAHVMQVLDPGKAHNESEAWVVAKFYNHMQGKDRIICPHCKSAFDFLTFCDEETLACNACVHEKKGERGIRLDRDLFDHPAIQLTDEDIRKHNSDVLFKHFKNTFIGNSGKLDPNYPGWISPEAPEHLMERGAKIKYHYDLLGEERVQELRIIFKKAYKNILVLLERRKAKEKIKA